MSRRPPPRHAKTSTPGLVTGIYVPRAADAAASAMTTYGVPLLVLATTGSPVLTGLAFALEWLPRLGAFAAAGTLVDRYGVSRVFRLAALARALVVMTAAVVLAASTQSMTGTVTVMVLAAVSGVATECTFIASETAGGAASRLAGDRAHRVQSVLMAIDQTAILAGPAAAGLLLHWSGPVGMLSILAGLSLLGTVLVPRHTTDTAPTPAASIAGGLRTGWSALRSLPALSWLVAGLVLSNLAAGLLQAAMPIIIVTDLGRSSTDAGLIWSTAAVASLLAITATRTAIDRWGLWAVGAVAATIAATATLAVSQTHTYNGYLLLIAVLMAGEGGMVVVLRTLRSQLIPADVFGSTLSVTALLLLAPFPAAGLLVAAVPPDHLGHAITGAAILQALGLAMAFTRLRTLPGLRAPTRHP
ncbi:MFS transporter [Streptomyces cyaneofuscatus]|uniref:MFS transporter n=1 Tax=Streptomyces cyaneofuscatus TaxID=66883 RepID=UPI0038003EFB